MKKAGGLALEGLAVLGAAVRVAGHPCTRKGGPLETPR